MHDDFWKKEDNQQGPGYQVLCLSDQQNENNLTLLNIIFQVLS